MAEIFLVTRVLSVRKRAETESRTYERKLAGSVVRLGGSNISRGDFFAVVARKVRISYRITKGQKEHLQLIIDDMELHSAQTLLSLHQKRLTFWFLAPHRGKSSNPQTTARTLCYLSDTLRYAIRGPTREMRELTLAICAPLPTGLFRASAVRCHELLLPA